jgi:hypothetical protein
VSGRVLRCDGEDAKQQVVARWEPTSIVGTQLQRIRCVRRYCVPSTCRSTHRTSLTRQLAQVVLRWILRNLRKCNQRIVQRISSEATCSWFDGCDTKYRVDYMFRYKRTHRVDPSKMCTIRLGFNDVRMMRDTQ